MARLDEVPCKSDATVVAPTHHLSVLRSAQSPCHLHGATYLDQSQRITQMLHTHEKQCFPLIPSWRLCLTPDCLRADQSARPSQWYSINSIPHVTILLLVSSSVVVWSSVEPIFVRPSMECEQRCLRRRDFADPSRSPETYWHTKLLHPSYLGSALLIVSPAPVHAKDASAVCGRGSTRSTQWKLEHVSSRRPGFEHSPVCSRPPEASMLFLLTSFLECRQSCDRQASMVLPLLVSRIVLSVHSTNNRTMQVQNRGHCHLTAPIRQLRNAC